MEEKTRKLIEEITQEINKATEQLDHALSRVCEIFHDESLPIEDKIELVKCFVVFLDNGITSYVDMKQRILNSSKFLSDKPNQYIR